MAYRNGTYVAFHAKGTSDQSQSDIRYYRTLQMWAAASAIEFKMVDSHLKTAAVRDTSLRSTLQSRLQERLRNSRHLLLIVTADTRMDADWVPFEIAQAIDQYRIPIIAAYPGFNSIMAPAELRPLWPTALAVRIDSGHAMCIHVPFRREAILDAISQFGPDRLPSDGLTHYTYDTYRRWRYVT